MGFRTAVQEPRPAGCLEKTLFKPLMRNMTLLGPHNIRSQVPPMS